VANDWQTRLFFPFIRSGGCCQQIKYWSRLIGFSSGSDRIFNNKIQSHILYPFAPLVPRRTVSPTPG
jgi:hypothetical protein